MELQQLFEQAAADSKTLSQKPSNDVLLQLYSLYKQGQMGDVQGEAPGNPFDIIGNAKYDAWAALKGMTQEEAMNKYIDLVNSLKAG